jgi:hypothetical protein
MRDKETIVQTWTAAIIFFLITSGAALAARGVALVLKERGVSIVDILYIAGAGACGAVVLASGLVCLMLAWMAIDFQRSNNKEGRGL